MKKRDRIYFVMILPSLAGILLFYCIPFFLSFSYTVVNNMAEKRFVGLANFKAMLSDGLFRQAAGNTLLFMALSVPISMALALLLAMGLQQLERWRAAASVLLLFPIVVPSGTVVYFWKLLFDRNGLVNKFLSRRGLAMMALSEGRYAMAVIVLLFLWKNISYNIVLFWSGLNWIPKVYYEQHRLESSSAFRRFWDVTRVYLGPTTLVVLLMSIVNSFRVFKEIYQLCGAYPTPEIYMLQHYMNNQFVTMNIQKLCTAAYIIFLGVSAVLLIVFYFQKKVTDTFF